LCGKKFIGGQRIENTQLWNEYTQGKQVVPEKKNEVH